MTGDGNDSLPGRWGSVIDQASAVLRFNQTAALSNGGIIKRWHYQTAASHYGWRRDSLKVGDRVIADEYLSKDNSKVADARNAQFPDGRKVSAGSMSEADSGRPR